MKKLITLLVAVFISFQISAQTFGGKLGTSLASMNGSDVEKDDMTIMNPGLLLGGFARFGEEKMRVTVELLYIQKGSKYTYDGDYARTALNYLETNVMGNYYVSDNFSLNAGIYIGYLMGAKWIVKFDGEKDSGSIELDDAVDTKIDFGSNFGLAYHINENMSIDLRYGMGLTSHTKDYKQYNSTIQIAFGYSFGN